jgi:hypothetical protein
MSECVLDTGENELSQKIKMGWMTLVELVAHNIT